VPHLFSQSKHLDMNKTFQQSAKFTLSEVEGKPSVTNSFSADSVKQITIPY
jgi:hypothetical protein